MQTEIYRNHDSVTVFGWIDGDLIEARCYGDDGSVTDPETADDLADWIEADRRDGERLK